MTQSPEAYFRHDPIDLSEPAFRLLRILKGKDSTICCELFQALVRQRSVAISYEALSYVWGSPGAEYLVEINGKPFRITKNLHEALRHLRLRNQDRIVWVDAICIDQDNKAEQGHQVEHMGDIYKEAAQVIYWLGPATYFTPFCFEVLGALQDRIGDTPHKDWTRQQWVELWKSVECRPKTFPGLQREGLRELLDRPWFRRIWILQEVANSQAAVVHCGKDSVSARVFALAPFLMAIIPEAHSQAVLDMMPGLLRKESWFSGKRDLYTLLRNFGDSKATDPRDLVYALLGISSDAISHIHPDYQKTETEVVETVFKFLYHVKISPTLSTQPAGIQDLCSRLSFFSEVALEAAAQDEECGGEAAIHLLRTYSEVNINPSTLRAAVRNGKRGRFMTELLLDHMRNGAAYRYPAPSPVLMEDAAKNESSGDEVAKFLLNRRDFGFRITENVLVAMGGNRGKGRILLDLFSNHIDESMITERVITFVASNDVCGDEIMAGLQKKAKFHFLVTENVVFALARNRKLGKKLLDMFSSHISENMITGRVIEAAAKNDGCGDEIVMDLKEHWGPLKFTEGLLRSAAANPDPKRGERVAELLLNNGGVTGETHRKQIQRVLRWADGVLYVHDGLIHREAVLANEIEVLQILLRWFPIKDGQDGLLALKAAFGLGRLPMVKLLLGHLGVEAVNLSWKDIVSRHGELQHAIYTGNLTLVRSLKFKPLKPPVKPSVQSPVTPAVCIKAREVKGLMSAIASGSLEEVTRALLVSGPFSINGTIYADDGDGETPLHLASRIGNTEMVQLLLKHGADSESISYPLGRTPLSVAAAAGHLSVLRTLLDHGADVESTWNYGQRTPLSIAAEEGHPDVVALLLQHGADVTKRCNMSRNPLAWAEYNNKAKCKTVLLNAMNAL